MKLFTLSMIFYLSLSLHLYGQITLVDYGSPWAYFDQESEPPNQGVLDWFDPDFIDTTWSSGPAHIGYGDGDEVTLINDQTETVYLRHAFLVSDPSVYQNIDLNLIYDDGAVVYLNGMEEWRVNMPSDPISYSTFASSNSGDNAFASTSITNSLVTGMNLLAIEVHQRSSSSSDISFDFKLAATIPGAVNVTRGPYLQKGSPSNIAIKWRTASNTESIVRYGTNQNNLVNQTSDLTPKTEHEILLSGLAPNTKYFYEVSNSSAVLVTASDDLYFQTSPNNNSADPYTFWVLGDCGTGNSNQRAVRNAYYNYIDTNHTDGILLLGDNAYNDGLDAEYQLALFENMYEAKLKNTVTWSCLGNHDGHSANSDTQTGPYYDIFSFPANGESGGTASGTEAYYSFDYGNVHFISLDSYETDRSVGGAMYNWCKTDLQNTLQKWIIAFWHHPAYSKGSHDSDTESNLVQMRQNFMPLLDSNGVDLILSGHSHSYERSYFLNGHYGNSTSFSSTLHTFGANGFGDGRLNSNGAYEKEYDNPNGDNGLVYVTAGSSGKTSSGDLDHQAMYYSVAQLGSCVLEIHDDQLDLKFLRNTGAIEDYFTIIKAPDCMAGEQCDDGNPCTIDDFLDEDCNCIGGQKDQVVVVGDAGAGTLRGVIDCATEGDSITFSSTLDGDTIRLISNHILVDKNLVLLGKGILNTTIDASNISYAFELSAGKSLQLHGLSLISGYGTSGSAIRNNGQLMLENVSILRSVGAPLNNVLILNQNAGSQLDLKGSVDIQDE
jgi:hypothetical protein